MRRQRPLTFPSFYLLLGRAEKSLALLRDTTPTLATYSFRPAGIVPIHPVPEAGTMQKVANCLVPVLKPFFGSYLINTDVLATGMIEAAINGASGEIKGWPGKGLVGNEGVFSNEEIKELAQVKQ